jgi:peptidoglycan/LPS O-acetylase OafA/YrhL
VLAEGYRPALDGVRAVAVVAVIAYHLELPLLGGFLGVDLFFVLSGYLITRLLLDEHSRTGRVHVGHFWARRVRRLLPAALLVVAACAVAAARGPLLDLDARRDDMIATIFYYANWHFIETDQSYFTQYEGVSPLRHMWSLAIEEQFYVVWPLVVLGLLAVGRGRTRGLAVVAAAAAVLSVLAMAGLHDSAGPSRAYYGTGTRAHALLVGALLAVLLCSRRELLSRAVPARLWTLLALLSGTAVVLAMLLVTDTSTSYYTGGSFVFALAAAALLLALEVGPDRGLRAGLSRPPLVAVGRVSYGLYLWHWPFVVWVQPSSWTAQLLIVALTAAAATVSFVLVERPIRAGAVPWLKRSARRLAVVAPVAVAITVGLALQLTGGPTLAVAQQVEDHSVTPCPGPTSYCVRVPAGEGQPMVVLSGDSTSLALDPGMRVMARQAGFGYTQSGRNGCSFVPVRVGPPGTAGAAQAERCATSAEGWLAEVRNAVRPDVWVMADRLLLSPLHTPAGELEPTDEARRPLIRDALVRTLRGLVEMGDEVVILETPPLAEAVDCALGMENVTCGDRSRSTRDPATRLLNQIYREAAAEVGEGVRVVPTADILCTGDDGMCPALLDGVLGRYDTVHYTAEYSRRFVRQLLPRLEIGVG